MIYRELTSKQKDEARNYPSDFYSGWFMYLLKIARIQKMVIRGNASDLQDKANEYNSKLNGDYVQAMYLALQDMFPEYFKPIKPLNTKGLLCTNH